MSAWEFLELAAWFGTKRQDLRTHHVGAVGRRNDGVLVMAYNGAATGVTPHIHAEARLCRKLDYGSTVYVARKTSVGYRLARPCNSCLRALRLRRVKRVYYTIGDAEYGVLDL